MVAVLNISETHIWGRGLATKITHQEQLSSEWTNYILVCEMEMHTVTAVRVSIILLNSFRILL